ncbi:MAG: hypothetical protein QGG46_07400 [Gammaproteobacteria bacterium]|jgi:hypothetical protein|nr:hypothetical protein [Gammaproteobacteria bacterium]
MTVLWILVAVGPIAADFNATHLFNPDWPPHARFHMMTVFTSAVAIALFGLYTCWGPAKSRLDSLRLGAILGTVYTISLLVAAFTMPMYGGSLYWIDTKLRPISITDENLIVFASTTLIFLILLVVLFRQSE